jgi:cellulose synthase/poly-beta-1,6-N-acetylglucosamine synthase-like glycosyltransferase
MLPTVGETAEIIEPAIAAIDNSCYPNDKIIILLALEEREDRKSRDEKVEILKDKFCDKFFEFMVTVHEVKTGEMKCKASNTTYAAKKLKIFLEDKKIPLEHVVLSNFDCDTQVHPQFLAALSYEYIVSPNRLQQAYQPLPMYHNNLWDTIAPVRIIVTGSSFWHMVESMRPEHMVTFSSHSEAFKTIIDVDYWPVNVISEDSVIYWKAYDYFCGDYQVRPIYLPVSLDAVLGNNYSETLANQYRQKRRWAYGIENLAMLARAFKANPLIPFGKKIKYIWTMLEGHHSWATSPFILALLGWLPLIFGGDAFNESVLAHNLPYITRSLMTLALVGLIISMFLSFLIMPIRPKRHSRKKYFAMFFQWFLAPVIAPFLGASPAVDAQTRLLFGKYFGSFWVTPKKTKK